MNAIQLYKFINDNSLEWRWDRNEQERDVILFVPLWHIEEFNELFSESIYGDGPITCYMMHNYIAFWMLDICGYYGIDSFELFGNDPEPSRQ